MEGAKPRKYYKRTDKGEEIYRELSRQWKEMVESMNQLLS
jgi:DNA-binding PadR family transcriptional regulator